MFYRQVGFMIVKSRGGIFKGWESLTHKKVRFINRQKGSGVRLLVDRELEERGISGDDIKGYDDEVYTHFEVGLALVSGEADVGIASAAVAKILDLDFQPIISERFDMILDKNTFFQPAIQTFMEALKSDQFKNRVSKIGNYDFKDTGRIFHS
jgi:putative molybdopterin biosynthesis protein